MIQSSSLHSFPDAAVLILGRGYVGTALSQRLPRAQWTRRDTFDLRQPSTWENHRQLFSSSQHVIWTFPAASNATEEQLALDFFDEFLSHAQVLIYGTTSAYLVKTRHEWITEGSTLDLSQVRTRTEESLRSKGACILHLSGIFGPHRDPLAWYQKGLIRSRSSYLNLIHVNDIVHVTEKLIQRSDKRGQRFNLSNGKPKTHQQITEELKEMNLLPPEFELPSLEVPTSKRVSSSKIRDFLSLSDSDFIDFPLRDALKSEL